MDEASEKPVRMTSLSVNVKRLRFMQVSNNEASRQQDKKMLFGKVDWVANKEEFDAIDTLPLTFHERSTIQRVPLSKQYRRSYDGFNPVVEKYQRIIAHKLELQKKEAEDDAEIALLAKNFRPKKY
eukprot:Protomagalhaensia_wolfi_Nauph_80__1322@NODE_178_length_3281_cov_479_197717_g134_i0_p6_GENE_NODE_178_length_3281_cov_479_197717_g134_i0NODE_178_length_3281_cov_479_197717_g134_i0_p6_ORF_typecomplete_len126_score24_38MPP6/PF10175_9/4e06_NODE_178_length_3281_cov_479_197717_g134_i019022279